MNKKKTRVSLNASSDKACPMTILELPHFKILLASCNKEKITQIKEAFAHCDCQIITASSMSLALFLAQKNLPDLIFSELKLTDGDGCNFLREIRQEPDIAQIPFIFLVRNSSNSLTLEEAIKQGANSVFDCLLKGSQLLNLALPILNQHLLVKKQRAEETPE